MKITRSGLSFLLNLTDGLLRESLEIQVIATFNTGVKNIDKAILRKRWLITIYEFRKLTIEKTNALLRKMNKEIQVIQEMTSQIFSIWIKAHFTNLKLEEPLVLGIKKKYI